MENTSKTYRFALIEHLFIPHDEMSKKTRLFVESLEEILTHDTLVEYTYHYDDTQLSLYLKLKNPESKRRTISTIRSCADALHMIEVLRRYQINIDEIVITYVSH